MKLSDIMSALELSIYAEVALVIFIGVFLGVVLHIWRDREQFQQARLLPLSDERDAREVYKS
jgi:cbb3-type cytochrome oxidase subunit 3